LTHSNACIRPVVASLTPRDFDYQCWIDYGEA
jgi:hypothetical protein